MKKVISFSLFGDHPKYNVGAVKNAELAKKHYPGWEVRIYLDHTVPDTTKHLLLERGAVVVEKQTGGGYTPLFWRFDPLYDPTVDAWISRDCDSRLCEREAFAVQEWLETDRTFHLMRDAHNHDCYPVLAGMFGVNNNLFNKRYSNRQFFCLPDVMFQKDADQLSLWGVHWDVIKTDNVTHEHWFHNLPVTDQLDSITRNPLETYDGQGVYGHVTNRKQNYPDQFLEGSINKPFQSNSVEAGLYLGQIITENGKPVWNDDVLWEYNLRGADSWELLNE